MGGPLSVTFSEIYMVKMDVVMPSKLIVYCRFVDGIYSRRKLGDNDQTVIIQTLNLP